MTLFEYLCAHANDRLPMHMPGHKRRAKEKYLKKLCAEYDITEISGADDLHDPSGIIMEAQSRASELWRATHSHILVGGSTVGILAGMYSCLSPNDEVIIARNCHKSVYHAMEICGAAPIYVVPKQDAKTGIFLSVDPSDIESAFEEHPSARLAVITSPTYEGIVSDVEKIADICHSHGAALLVDEAHGAHFGICDGFPKDAVDCGADIVVRSLHKTLPSLTQTAAAHVGGLVENERFARALNVFETSSPSYLLMASADGCVDFCSRRRDLFEKWTENLDKFYDSLELKVLDVFKNEDVYAVDKSKIVISSANAGISGFRLAQILRDDFNIEVEMADMRHIIAMTGVFDGKKVLSKFARALEKIDKTLSFSKCPDVNPAVIPEYAITSKQALSMTCREVFSGEAVGCICAEYIWAYPPGIPLIIPGEIMDYDVIDRINELKSAGADIKAFDKSLKTFKVIENMY